MNAGPLARLRQRKADALSALFQPTDDFLLIHNWTILAILLLTKSNFANSPLAAYLLTLRA